MVVSFMIAVPFSFVGRLLVRPDQPTDLIGCATGAPTLPTIPLVSTRAVEGASRQYIRISDEGGKGSFHFCPNCGATVFYTTEAMPGVVAVPVGAFADPSFPPTRSVWEERRHSWLRLPDDIEHVS
jgi:hypothetical protein